MKKLILLSIFCNILFLSTYAQVIQCETSVKYNNEKSGITADLTVKVKIGSPEFTYFLMTNDPVKGSVLQKSEKTKKTTYTFKGIKPGSYFVKVEDYRGFPAGETVIVEETTKQSN